MKKLSHGITSVRAFFCPQCDKQRMIRPLDHVVLKEKTDVQTKDNNVVSLFKDICDHCKRSNFVKYLEPTRADIKRILKEAHVQPNETLEDLL